MKKVKVINKGRRLRDRLGLRFLPNKEQIVEVNNREHLALKAVRDFDVQVINDEDDSQIKIDPEKVDIKGNTVVTKDDSEKEEKAQENEAESIQELQKLINDSNINEVIELVNDKKITVDEAIAYETVGKNRSSLLDKLEGLK